MKSLAAVFHEAGVPLRLTTFRIPHVAQDDILVAVKCCTLCGSDLHTIQGTRAVEGPTVLGHEIIATVAALPANGQSQFDLLGHPIELGDRITWSVAASCGRCFYCRHQLPQKCERLFKYGHEVVSDAFPATGGLSRHCQLVAGTSIIRLPAGLPDAVACPANCATSTVAAAFRTAGNVENKTVVIHGCGMLGLTAAAMASAHRASHIIATDILPGRCQRALDFGATEAIAADDAETFAECLKQCTESRGADVILELSGAASVIENSITQLRIGGHLILVGSVFPSRSVSVSPERIVRKMIRIDGVHNYAPTDLVTAVQFLDRIHTEFPFETLVEREYPLENVNDAIRYACESDAVRVAVRPEADFEG